VALNSPASFTNLRKLDLSYAAITSSGLRTLAPLMQIETLDLTGTADFHRRRRLAIETAPQAQLRLSVSGRRLIART
jgi:hypothetical protein